MTPQIFLVRHAKTLLNNASSEAIRGHSDIPISGEGEEALKQTAEFLKGHSIKRILASPLQRAMMTALFIADKIGAKVTPNSGLTPWDLGNLTGKRIEEVAPKMNYYQDYPDIKVPDGESYRDFYDRWSQALDRMLAYAEKHPDEILTGVVHSRNLLSLPSIIGKRPMGEVPVKGGPPPESVTRVYLDDDTWKYETIFELKQ